ncbi:MAG: peptide deformylase [Halieaceae bacterium]|jgi:peptide deformylase|nr:peptide deformylase [Halieaceae bacterium]MDB2379347.1 peptide deformylase [Luminiphilus sp.]MBT5134900.1 peptide deformylase [Halieaceae bacterium]MDB2434054.1 peptide deformylase [Luminiphilus sp.]MDB2653838.1 peptide deformylase [Luminiphilus sp.]
MAIRKILEFPDPRLRTRAAVVPAVDGRIQTLIDDMFETMYDANGIGLAASQIDVHEQVIVIDLSSDGSAPRVFVNPTIEVIDETLDGYEEGCLSVPGFSEAVERPKAIKVEALDRDGRPIDETVTGLLAVCLQHEMDHLQGKLFVDYLSPLKRQRIRQRLEKEQRRRA